VADGETMLFLHQWDVGGKRIVPIFSSLSRLADFVDKQAAYVRINAGALLSMLEASVGVVLNPGSPYSRELPPAEIQMLLDGTLFAPDTEEFVLSDGDIFLGQPADYPAELVEALQELFAEHPAVRAAYLAQMYAPESGDEPHLVIGLDVLRNFDEVVEEAVSVAGEVLAEEEFVDFIQIGRDALSDYLLGETTPFYERD
ncbi:MAG: enhanced serine sensitivity protein SseB C-terminal domain-containing protein, partial [Anaerolineae bacterium]